MVEMHEIILSNVFLLTGIKIKGKKTEIDPLVCAMNVSTKNYTREKLILFVRKSLKRTIMTDFCLDTLSKSST